MSQFIFWIVQPKTDLSKRWEYLLHREGWTARVEPDFGAFCAEAEGQRVGIALVDHGVLKPDAAEAVKKLKARRGGISLILTAPSTVSQDKVIAVLEAGADDNFPEDIDDRLLLAKLKSHLRRVLPSMASALDVLKSPGGELKVDRSRHEAWVKTRGKWTSVADLTPTEFQFLALFLETPGKVLERRFIVETVWQGQDEIRPGTVDKHIESLRRKLGGFGSKIRTVYGVGYALRDG